MGLRNFLSKTGGWVKDRRLSRIESYQPQLNNDGLLENNSCSAVPIEERPRSDSKQTNEVVVKTVNQTDKSHSLEKLHGAFDKLIEQLHGIGEHLNNQAAQQENLVARMDKLPELLENFPAIVRNQEQLTEQLLEQLKATSVKDHQFIDAVEKLPSETVKQTDVLVNINHQLAAAADTDVQMTESFNKFDETMDKLDKSTVNQTDGIMQMSKTFATSDRYLKYLMSKQNKRFMWAFTITVIVCTLTILILTGVIIYLTQ